MIRFVCKYRYFNIIFFLFIFLIILSIFGILWIRSNVIAVEYKLSQLEEKKKNLLREQKILLAQKSSLTSIARLERGEVFSLHFPDRKRVIYITQDSNASMNRVSFNKRD